MKKIIGKYLLYIYNKYIINNINDVDIYKDKYIPIVKIITFYLNFWVWTYAIIFFPFFIIGMIIDENEKRLFKQLNIYSIKKSK
ncbi:hypothetical protein M0Q97_03700 [Candidatus Dojkabacteria bacterium]|jgi:hypothetical protein|nr:hypothetical protein [Candidatus Dojkabacteria bacterium]